MCVPELSPFIDYTQAPGVLPGEDRKPIPVATNTSPANVASPTNNNFLHEGKWLFNYLFLNDDLLMDASRYTHVVSYFSHNLMKW